MKNLISTICLSVLLALSISSLKGSNGSTIDFETPASETKSLKVLLIGSSFGIDAIHHFPILANKAGVDIVCGNLYSPSITLDQIVDKCNADEDFATYAINKGTNWIKKTDTKTVSRALSEYEWDVIILQRSARNSHTWTNIQRESLFELMSYIKANSTYNPKIMFNSCNSFPVSTAESFTREDQLRKTEEINISTKRMQEDAYLDFIPNNVAVQNARNTFLREFGTSVDKDIARDKLHLDSGIGNYVTGCTMFEKLLGERFGLSIRNLDYIPTIDELEGLHGNVNTYTPITEEMARVAKLAAIAAVMFPYTVSESIAINFPPR